MIIILLLISLQISISIHIVFLIQYVLKKDHKFLRRYINTAISNIILAGLATVLSIYKPQLLQDINLKLLLWLMSGLMMMIMIMIKAGIIRNIWKRAKDPTNYHFNYFGKKVLDSRVVLQEEVYIFLFTVPFFLMSGAYFFARLVNLILYRRL